MHRRSSARSDGPLAVAMEMSLRAAAVGFDWPDVAGVMDKIHEEVEEIDDALSARDTRAAKGADEVGAEIGDLLFAVVNLARKLEIDPGDALLATCEKFKARFSYVEAGALALGRRVEEMKMDELDALWEQAKAAERAKTGTSGDE